jgi:hypothetical protein
MVKKAQQTKISITLKIFLELEFFKSSKKIRASYINSAGDS